MDEQNKRICPKCGSNNTTVQIVNKVMIKNKHHGLFWWLIIGWWFVPIMWMIFTIPKILIKLFGLGHKKYKTINKEMQKVICQNCGHSWKVK